MKFLDGLRVDDAIRDVPPPIWAILNSIELLVDDGVGLVTMSRSDFVIVLSALRAVAQAREGETMNKVLVIDGMNSARACALPDQPTDAGKDRETWTAGLGRHNGCEPDPYGVYVFWDEAADAIEQAYHRGRAEGARQELQTICDMCRFSFVGMAPAGCPHHRMCKRTKEDTGQGSYWFAKCETLGNGCRAWEPREEPR